MGTPHQGSEGATWGILARNIASIFVNTNKGMLEHLTRNSEWLEYQQTQFVPISNRFETIYFYETYPTPLPSGGSLLVSPSGGLRSSCDINRQSCSRWCQSTLPAFQELWVLPRLRWPATTPIWLNSIARRMKVSGECTESYLSCTRRLCGRLRRIGKCWRVYIIRVGNQYTHKMPKNGYSRPNKQYLLRY